MKRESEDSIGKTEFSLLKQEVGSLKGDFNELRAEIRTWMTARTRSPWQFVGLLLGILVPLGWFFNVYVTSVISPVNGTAVQALATANANTSGLTRTIEVQNTILSNMAALDAERKANEREVETQIDAMSQMLNTQFANQQRTNADFQNALHGMDAKIPAAPSGPWFFPNISNRNHRNPRTQQ